jgi:hypothetical protein
MESNHTLILPNLLGTGGVSHAADDDGWRRDWCALWGKNQNQIRGGKKKNRMKKKKRNGTKKETTLARMKTESRRWGTHHMQMQPCR